MRLTSRDFIRTADFRKSRNPYPIHCTVFEFMPGCWFLPANARCPKHSSSNRQLAMPRPLVTANIWVLKVFGIIRIFGSTCKIVRTVARFDCRIRWRNVTRWNSFASFSPFNSIWMIKLGGNSCSPIRPIFVARPPPPWIHWQIQRLWTKRKKKYSSFSSTVTTDVISIFSNVDYDRSYSKRHWNTSIMGRSFGDNAQRWDLLLCDPFDKVSHLDFQKRYPSSRKTYFYKKTRVEKYAPYSMKDGIVLKVSEFADYDCEWLQSENSSTKCLLSI